MGPRAGSRARPSCYGGGGSAYRVAPMTIWARSDMAAFMLRRWGLLLLGLLACSLVATATVHAREALGAPAISCGGEMHVDGDRDQVPADPDQGVPHHHGTCHGHAFALEANPQAAVKRQRRSSQTFARRGHSLASRSIDPALRPPRA